MLVLDASVIAKWFKIEKDREKALKIREDFLKGDIDITFPDLLLFEIANLLRFSKIFSPEDTNLALKSINEMNIDIIVPPFDLIEKAVFLAFNKDITFYDAIYVAISQEIGYKFVTADENLFHKISDLENVALLKDL